MKYPIPIVALFVLASGCASDEHRPKSEEIWRLVAQSHVIAAGTLDVPFESIQACLSSNHHEYVELTVDRNQALKGNPPPSFTVRWFTEPRDYAPDPERVLSLDGKKVLLFLLEVDDASVKGLYFAGKTPRALSEADPGLLEEVSREVAEQGEVLSRFEDAFPPAKEPLYAEVKRLIDATTIEDTQMEAFRRLEELGQKAVPAIIILMDDRRDLAVPAITLQNPPGHWEAVRHYSPRKVVDALHAILNQITGDSFGQIYNGGTESKRRATVNGWRIYLYHWKKKNPMDG